MADELAGRIPACAVNMLARQEWFSDPGVVSRAKLTKASWFARLLSSRRFAKTETVAITLGRTIHIKMDEFNPHTVSGLALLAHEVKHVEQYERKGMFGFVAGYLGDYLFHGYGESVSFEAEAYEFERQVRAHLAEEFGDNPGRTPCQEMAEPHTPNGAFAKTVPEVFRFPR